MLVFVQTRMYVNVPASIKLSGSSVCIPKNVCIYIERERERERDRVCVFASSQFR